MLQNCAAVVRNFATILRDLAKHHSKQAICSLEKTVYNLGEMVLGGILAAVSGKPVAVRGFAKHHSK